MKKLFGLVVIVASLFLLTSCGDDTVNCTGPDGDYVNYVFDKDGNLVSAKGVEDGEEIELTEEQVNAANAAFALLGEGSIRDSIIADTQLDEGWTCK